MPTKLARSFKHSRVGVPSLHGLNLHHRLMLSFLLIVLLMLAGNAVLLWQFQRVQAQAERLSAVDQELITVLHAHISLLSFCENLDAETGSEKSELLVGEVEALRSALLEDSRRTRTAFGRLRPDARLDAALLPSLIAIQDALTSQLDAIVASAKSGDWQAVHLQLAEQIRPLESRSAALVGSIDRETSEQRAEALLNIENARRRIFVVAAATALLTLIFATFLGVAITYSITRPLESLAASSAALARGDFSHRIATSGTDEIDHLGNTFNDMTAQLQDLYRELRSREAYLAEAQRLSHTGSFGWDVVTGEIHWSEETLRMFEFELTTKVTAEMVLDRTHPEDRQAVRQVLELAVRDRKAFDVVHRLLMPDGSAKYVHVVGHPSAEELGSSEFVGAVTDITEQRRAEDALRRSERYLAEAQTLARSGSWAWNLRTQALFWSQGMFRLLDYSPEKTKPSMAAFFARVHPEDRSLVEQRQSLERRGTDSEGDFRILLPDGTIRHLHSIAHPLVSESGEISEVIGTTMDVSDHHAARTALQIAFEEIAKLKDQLYKENIALREEIDRSSMFEEIVGESPAVQSVLARVAKVAPTDSTVLITGETGTGKELIARAIHRRSPRSLRAFISVNCAAIPPSLISSELFGHEKGAFTGAIQRRLGRFELAEGGTIFLDEVGELPPETQVALLRVLQEREFERIGGTKVIRADVRVIAATNRDLQAAIDAGAFRSDLYYRLNVFPIELPPLRKRKEDIQLLVEYFIDRYASEAGKRIRGISRETLARLQSYPWPGNIRELQNVIERSVIISEGENFIVDDSWLSSSPPLEESKLAELLPLRMSPSQEKETIEAALAQAQGRVSGTSGAAAKLGIPASTLESKIKALRINKYRFKT